MGISVSTTLPRLSTAAFLLCGTLLLSASASSADQAPMSIELHLATPATFSQGEPIVLHYTVSNNSATEQLSFDAGPRHEGWYRLSITNAAGQRTTAAVPNPSLDDLAPQGLHPAPEISLPPSGTVDGDIVATQALAVAQPGDYTLTLRLLITYYLEPRGAWYPKGRPADQVPLSFRRDYNFHLKITKADPKRLSAVAETLRYELQDARFAGQWTALLTALSVLPEAAALPIWQSLVLDPATPSGVLSDAAELLGGLRSPGAADLLGQILFDRIPAVGSDEDGVKASARRAVAEMYHLGNDQVKQRLEQVYMQHGASKDDLLEAATMSNPN